MRALLPLLILAACDTGSPAVPAEATLLAWYPFDDLVDGKATDASGNARHGMCTACPGVQAGKSNGAFRFDGGDQQVDVPPNVAFDAKRAFSAAAWVYLDAAPATIPGCAINKVASWELCVTPGLVPSFGTLTGTTPLALATWNHIAVIWDGTTKQIFVNGAEAASKAETVTFNNAGLTLGVELAGVVDEPQIYDGILSAAELAALVAAESPL